MERLTREMTFEEEYIILQKEVKKLFDKEDRESEPPESHCVVRRALRCIKKLVAELEPYKEYKDLEGLKAIESDGFTDDLLNMGFTKGYNKAIDDFVERLITYLGIENATKYGNKNAEQMRNSYGTFMNYEIVESIKDVAEQLKAGGK